MVDLRPLSLGEIIDRSASIWRANWRALFKLFLGFQLATYILMKGWELVGKTYFPVSRGGSRMVEMIQANPLEAVRQLGGSTLVAVAITWLSVFFSTFVAVVATRYLYPQLLGKRASLGESLQFTWGKRGAILGFYLLMTGWTLLVLVLALIPGSALFGGAFLVESGPASVVLGGLGVLGVGAALVVVVLWFFLRFMLASQVLALEEAGALGAFRRSNELSSGRVAEGLIGLTKVRLAIVFTVVAVIIMIVSVLFTIPQAVVQLVYANPFNPAGANLDAVPALLAVPTELLQVFAQTVIAPLWVVFDLVFYTDMRVRREGLDLELKLKEAQA
ncbi:MAG: hypothetical protein H6Q89_3687 [Myxococcaceae bacterium]|nr:hypothetical protein [Myxococcaceae bacterium]